LNVFPEFFEEHKFEQLHFVFAKFYCDVSLAKTYMDFIRGSWEYQRIMGAEDHGSARGPWEYQRSLGVMLYNRIKRLLFCWSI
jgi:hypothetical protein